MVLLCKNITCILGVLGITVKKNLFPGVSLSTIADQTDRILIEEVEIEQDEQVKTMTTLYTFYYH